MRFPIFLVVLATALVANAVLLPVSLRQTMPDDAIGEFKRRQFLGGNCPGTITHSETVNAQGFIPHSAMTINNNDCTDNGNLRIFSSAEDALAAVSADSSKQLIQNFISANVGAIYGVEESARICSFRLQVNTLVIIFKPEFNVVVGLDSYSPTLRYMIVDDPTVDGICRFSAPLREAETAVPATPEPTAEPSMAPPAVVPGVVPGVAPSVAPSMPPSMESSMEPSPAAAPQPASPASPDAAETSEEGSPVVGGVGGGNADATATENPVFSATETSEEPTPTDDDDDVCFPADGSVELEDGSVKRMDEVEIGDSVKVGQNLYSEVFMFSHRLSNVKYNFVKMDLENGHSLEATSGHYVYVNGGLSAASNVKVGDSLELDSGDHVRVATVSVVRKSGLFNPQTLHGDILVNGVKASTFTQSVEVCTATALLAPLRLAYAALGWSGSFLDGGMDSVAKFMPKGAAAL
ncbi:unnamed protein product [Agarophyton chilense]